MKKCIICGKEHEGGCDKGEWDGVLRNRFGIPNAIENIEDKALKVAERQHIAKKRGRKSRNG